MNLETVDRCLEILQKYPSITKLDITGGAPELNPHFKYFVSEAKKLDEHVMVRHNLTVTLDKHPRSGESMEYLPQFFNDNDVEVISSLPYYQKFFTDKQRGRNVFEKSITSLQRLNALGFGETGTAKILNLVYNPAGAFLPAGQADLQAQFKKELREKYGIVFNGLFTITNMPIHRFKDSLIRNGNYDSYLTKLVNAFNPTAAEGIMCRSFISVGYDGRLYDCDFNQMLDMQIKNGQLMNVFNFDFDYLLKRDISFGAHCFGCTAGAGSSCGGETA
jgi:radical SAM/Cys-rich protein